MSFTVWLSKLYFTRLGPCKYACFQCTLLFQINLVGWANDLLHRNAPTIDLVLLSHGDLQHAGLYAYAHAHWGLKAPTYSTIPVQAIARIATLEEIEAIRAQEDVEVGSEENQGTSATEEGESKDGCSKKFIASVEDVREAFEAVQTLRYSQPAHLQGGLYSGQCQFCIHSTSSQESAKVLPSLHLMPATPWAEQCGRFGHLQQGPSFML